MSDARKRMRGSVSFAAAVIVAACAVEPQPADRAVTQRFDARRLAWQGDFEGAEKLLRTAREAYADTTLAAGHLDVALGNVLLRRAAHDRIIAPEVRMLFERAVEIATRTQDQELLGAATFGLGRYAYEASPESWDEARSRFEDALEIHSGIHDTLGMARAHASLGLLDQRLARFDDAEPHLETALELARAVRSDFAIGEIERHLGFQKYLRGDQVGALAHFESSFEARRAAGYLDGAMFAQLTIGWTLIQLTRYRDAVTQLEQALAKAEKMRSPEGRLRAHVDLSTAYANLGETARAAEHADAVARIRAQMGWADPASTSGPAASGPATSGPATSGPALAPAPDPAAP